jgi:cytochrome c oxidase assembly protein subunit 15
MCSGGRSHSSANDGMLITRRHRNLLLAASLLTYLLVTLGGVVCVTDSSRGCPDWPACYGQLLPPMRIDSILEYTHRVMAALTSLLIVASAVVGWLKSRSVRWVAWPPLIAVFFLLTVSAFGAMVVLRGLEPGLAALDLGSALAVLGLMTAATVVAFARHRNPALPDRLSLDTSFARLALWTLLAVFVVLVSGVLVAASGSPMRCLGWPLYAGDWPVAEGRQWLLLARRGLAILASFLIVAVAVQAWRRAGATRVTAIVVGAWFVMEMIVGLLMALYGSPIFLRIAHAAVAAALWASLVVLVVLTGLASSAPTEESRLSG